VINNIKNVIDPENEWDSLYSIGKVDYMRVIKGKSKLESRYFIISLNHDATKLSKSIRLHWQIENNLHWTLDVQFNEDKSRMRKDSSAENFARLRHITLNLLKKENSKRLSIRNKRNKAGWDDNYLMLVLSLSNSDDIVA
jgi:predicted transposase YbfD/YdcC